MRTIIIPLTLIVSSLLSYCTNLHSTQITPIQPPQIIENNTDDNAHWVLADGRIIGLEVDGRFYELPTVNITDRETQYF